MIFTERVRALIKEKGITQDQFNKAVDISKNTLSFWEKESRLPKERKLKEIAEYFNVTVEYLRGEEDRETSDARRILHTHPISKQTELPVYGDVSAGLGTDARQQIIGWEVADEKYNHDEFFYLLVQGDSMSPDIKDGDYALVHSQDYIESGQIGVCVVENEGYIKKIEYEQDSLTLISFNPYYPPRKFEKDDMNNVHIIGRVIETKRKY